MTQACGNMVCGARIVPEPRGSEEPGMPVRTGW